MVEKSIVKDAPSEIVLAENVSFEDYLQQFGEQHAEWLMGKVILVVANNTQHQDILGFLYSLLNLFLGFKPLGRVLLAGVPMRLFSKRPAREPDLMVVLNENRARIKENFLDGAADIAVEIVSSESRERDYEDKFREYAAGGVREYWLADPEKRTFTIYALDEDKHYHPLLPDTEGRIISGLLPGFVLNPDLLWREELPNGAEQVQLVQGMIGEHH